ncbi:MAG: Na/Pi cotransporter family protein [Candidatus Hydrogenedentes bacterium]|nr:Na/Pi cotransporter family protein [Candidatus Hydrogenedentota bacterium]
MNFLNILRSHCAPIGLALVLAALLSACGNSENAVPARISWDKHASGNHQMAMYGEPFAKPLRAVVESAVRPGLLGGEGGRDVVPGVAVRFVVENPDKGVVFAESGTATLDAVTDVSGTARADVIAGTDPGDVIIHASLPEFPDAGSVEYRLVAGVQRIGAALEGSTGDSVGPVGVRLWNSDGTPASGVEVNFRAVGETEGARMLNTRVYSDASGRAETIWTLGSKVQRYFADVEIHDNRAGVSEEQRFDVRTVHFEAMAINATQMAVVLLGGLAVFVFGMKMMSEGLQRMADRRLKSILQFMTRNRFMAVVAGTLMTAMVQSSSATTVMTVGFVNAGLMTLKQAIGVVFGANIGTTVTAQIIAFKLDDLAYPSIFLGLLLMMFMKRQQLKFLGQVLLGFGLLFLGMQTMGGILKPLRYSPEFQAWFQLVDCTPVDGGMMPAGRALLCILIGTVTTVVVQSSSATVGLVLALASQGLIGFYTAVPLILGDNIGTTITANLAAIGTSRNARRAALAHTLFNVFGATYMYVLFFIPIWSGQPLFLGFVNWFTPGEVLHGENENLLRHIANIHTTFNLCNVVLFLGFTGAMARACNFLIPVLDSERDSVLRYLEPKLLSAPAIALEQAVKEVLFMVRKGQKSMNESCDLLCDGRTEFVESILAREDVIDKLQHEITGYLVELSRTSLDTDESSLIPALLHAVNDAERLGDHAEAQVELHRLLGQQRLALTEADRAGIRESQKYLNEEFEAIYRTLEKEDPKAVSDAHRLDERLNMLMKRLTDEHIKRLDAGECDVQAGVIYLDALAHLERVGDHLVNIAERAGRILEVTSSPS